MLSDNPASPSRLEVSRDLRPDYAKHLRTSHPHPSKSTKAATRRKTSSSDTTSAAGAESLTSLPPPISPSRNMVHLLASSGSSPLGGYHSSSDRPTRKRREVDRLRTVIAGAVEQRLRERRAEHVAGAGGALLSPIESAAQELGQRVGASLAQLSPTSSHASDPSSDPSSSPSGGGEPSSHFGAAGRAGFFSAYAKLDGQKRYLGEWPEQRERERALLGTRERQRSRRRRRREQRQREKPPLTAAQRREDELNGVYEAAEAAERAEWHYKPWWKRGAAEEALSAERLEQPATDGQGQQQQQQQRSGAGGAGEGSARQQARSSSLYDDGTRVVWGGGKIPFSRDTGSAPWPSEKVSDLIGQIFEGKIEADLAIEDDDDGDGDGGGAAAAAAAADSLAQFSEWFFSDRFGLWPLAVASFNRFGRGVLLHQSTLEAFADDGHRCRVFAVLAGVVVLGDAGSDPLEALWATRSERAAQAEQRAAGGQDAGPGGGGGGYKKPSAAELALRAARDPMVAADGTHPVDPFRLGSHPATVAFLLTDLLPRVVRDAAARSLLTYLLTYLLTSAFPFFY